MVKRSTNVSWMNLSGRLVPLILVCATILNISIYGFSGRIVMTSLSYVCVRWKMLQEMYIGILFLHARNHHEEKKWAYISTKIFQEEHCWCNAGGIWEFSWIFSFNIPYLICFLIQTLDINKTKYWREISLWLRVLFYLAPDWFGQIPMFHTHTRLNMCIHSWKSVI